ncbi:protein ANTAGONIST OF LIKE HETEROCHROMATIN PROTEIN 1-like [Anopheles stephensi]|uniref:protein ANTAGONIST OF LIKE HETEROCHROMATIN PROTEIN 1-like n=1 Tax=Anopheles stephensi TaxID=30069 RepID=UPI001658B2A5|nr:protein ANTAGONIST OF LIKE HETEROCHROMATIN PROTEIN 1-like [Anopheles stephensi]
MDPGHKRQMVENLFLTFATKQAELFKQYDANRKKRSKIFLQRLRYQLKRNGESHRKEWSSRLESELLDSIPTRKIWKLSRNDRWFRELFQHENNDQELLHHFRMDRSMFDTLVAMLCQDLAPHPLLAAQSCSTEKKVGIGLYKLTTGADYATIGNLFGVHKATVKNCVHQFCKSMVKNYMDTEIYLPDQEEMGEISKAFEDRSDIPMIIGAMGRLHVPITPSLADSKNYINARKWPSLILQAVVDNNHCFRHITCGHVGATEDSVVLGDSGLYQHFDGAELPTQSINGTTVKSFVVSESAYPLLPWLQHGYVTPQTTEEETFNEHLNKARICVDEAFEKLRVRFRILQRKIDIDINFVPQILLTCCILHNILEKNQTPYLDEWKEALLELRGKYPQPDGAASTKYTTTVEGESLRDVLKEHLQSKYVLYRTIEYNQVYFINEGTN